MTKILNVDGAICYVSGASIDCDGSPLAYAPKGSGLKGLDYLDNAGKPGNWYGILTDKNGTPIIQGADDPAPGFYVSPTSLQDRSKNRTDPTRYVDSGVVPYIAVSKDLLPKVKLGDLCIVLHKSMMWAGIVADAGPRGRHGEISMKMAEYLSIPSSPKNGGVDKGVAYIIFPNTTQGWPVDFEDRAMSLFFDWGGIDKVNKIFG